MNKHIQLLNFLNSHTDNVGKVVDIDPATDQLFQFDFTAPNTELKPEDVSNTGKFSAWVSKKLKDNNCRYGVGGYMEHRTLYARSELFDTGAEPRRLHLGIDIWTDAGTAVYAPMDGLIHSFADNDRFGDYGPTIILKHDLEGLTLYSLYGHLNRGCIKGLIVGTPVSLGQKLGAFGSQDENGHWPPHLHFQLMFDIGDCFGDYPGVGKYSEKQQYLVNIPDPNLILRFPEG